jgi:hypothetical protein
LLIAPAFNKAILATFSASFLVVKVPIISLPDKPHLNCNSILFMSALNRISFNCEFLFGLVTNQNLLTLLKKKDIKKRQPITSNIKQQGCVAELYFMLLFIICVG